MNYKVVRRNGVVVACGPNTEQYQPVVEEDDVFSIEEAMPPIPEVVSCSAWQIRKALNALGLRDAVEAIVAASDNPVVRDGWEFASQFFNNDPFVIQMGQAIGKTNEEVTGIIKYANTL